eukprot:scaffold67617_cov17-Tisochrysis_lutea.AAC.1
MKGRGRGGHRGGRGGHRADRDGPKLPSSLLAALGQDGAPVQFGRGRGRGGSRKQSRKQEREGHKAARLAHQKARAASKKRAHPDSGAQQQPGPKRHTAQPHGKAVNQPKDKPAKQQNPQQQQQNQQQKQLKAAKMMEMGFEVYNTPCQEASKQHQLSVSALPMSVGPAPAAKRAGVPGGSSKTHFHELLPGGALGASVQKMHKVHLHTLLQQPGTCSKTAITPLRKADAPKYEDQPRKHNSPQYLRKAALHFCPVA